MLTTRPLNATDLFIYFIMKNMLKNHITVIMVAKCYSENMRVDKCDYYIPIQNWFLYAVVLCFKHRLTNENKALCLMLHETLRLIYLVVSNRRTFDTELGLVGSFFSSKRLLTSSPCWLRW